jgi:imidazolonepropionase-like amidohydrolase
MLVLTNVSVFDGVNEKLKENCSILIDGEKIAGVKENDGTRYENCDVLDLQGRVLMPGLIDGHMHCLVCEIPEKDKMMEDRTPGGGMLENAKTYTAYRGVYSAKRVLEAGFTTVFDGGAPDFMDVALREAIQVGLFPGPDYHISGKQISVGPGHFPGLGHVANGEKEMREAVRTMLWWGVDHIKLKVSAPMRMSRRASERSEMSIEEIRAACTEAHSAGLMVGAHVRGAEPLKDFIKGGGDWIIHGTGIDDEGIEMMLKKNLYYFATLASVSKDPPSPELYAAKTPKVLASISKKGWENFYSVKAAYKAGVNIVFATDTGAVDLWPGDNAKEMMRLREIGMSNLEILRSATSVAAKAVLLDDSIGMVKPGLKANLIVLDKNPLQELEQMLHVKMVIKAGKIVNNRLPMAIPV